MVATGIIRKILRRTIYSFVTLILLVSFLFLLIRISPGDPAAKYISPKLSPQLIVKLKIDFNLNESLPEQYVGFVLNSLRGDFGTSYNYRIPVTDVIWRYLKFTLLFTFIAFSFQVIVSYLLAFVAIKNKNKFVDKLYSNLSFLFYSTPVFVSGVILVYIFSLKLGLFPTSGLQSFDNENLSFFPRMIDYAKHLFLPVITISLVEISVFFKYLKDNIDSVSNQPFILNLRANGYTENEIIIKHILPNSINPFISIAAVELGTLLSGALIVEMIFSLPGMGRLTMDAILSRDYPLIIGCAFVSAFLVILTQLVADIVKVFFDKRLANEMLN